MARKSSRTPSNDPAGAPLDFCGLDCPECGGNGTLGAIESRPLAAGQGAGVRCRQCGFSNAHLVREADGSLIVHPGPLADCHHG